MVYPSISQDKLSALYKRSSTGLLDNPPARYIDFPLKELQAGLLRPVPKEAASQEELVHYRALLDGKDPLRIMLDGYGFISLSLAFGFKGEKSLKR